MLRAPVFGYSTHFIHVSHAVMSQHAFANRLAGNNFQDEFAAFRRGQGLPAMTIDIGYLLSVGFIAGQDVYADHVKAMGLKVMQTSDLHGLLAAAIEGLSKHPGQVMCGLPFNEHGDTWYWIYDARFGALRNLATGTSANKGQVVSLREELVRCGTISEEAVQIITKAMVQRLASLMMISEEDMAVECSVFDVMQNIPMTQLACNLAEKSKLLVERS